MCLPAFSAARIRCLLSLFFIIGALARAIPQQGGDEVTPEVQRLYAEAKDARKRGDNATAVQKYKSILKLAPHLAAAYNNLGMLYFDGHDYTRAADILQQGLSLNPNMPGASAMLGMSYFQLGKNDKA